MIVKCKGHSFGETPQVVATVTSAADLNLLASGGFPAQVDVLEFRLDNLVEHLDQAETVAKSLAAQPLLMTARDPEEGGVNKLDGARRVELLNRFLPFATLLDMEARNITKPGYPELLAAAKAQNVGVVGSIHDFDKMPAPENLYEMVYVALSAGIPICKVAVYIKEMTGLLELVTLLESASFPFSVMGMGPLGKLSRLVLAKAGSALNYGYLQTANASGQWQAAELKRLIGEL